MGLPRKLKNFNLFNEGQSYVGEVAEITLPKLSRKMESYLAAGMGGPVMADFGNEALTLEWTLNGFVEEALLQYGAASHSAVQLRFCGALDDDTGGSDAVEVTVRGRHQSIDMGTIKPGTETAHKYSTVCSYYKLSINDRTLIELDFMNGILNIGGTDKYAAVRKAIGL
jgi:P2 family phage contractile tail tube protein